MNNTDIILKNKFKYFESNTNVNVSLFRDRIELIDFKGNDPEDVSNSKKTHTIFIDDMSGSMIGKSLKKNDKNAYLTIYAYPKEKKKNKKVESLKRKRITVELECGLYNTYDENLMHVNKWQKHLESIIKNKDFNSSLDDNNNNNNNNDKPYLVFVNPKSGSGKAKNIYFERIIPVWSEANISDNLFLTEYANHARNHVKKIKIKDYRGLIIVSGDGLVYEIINGLMERDDWQEAIKMPICQIPGGSANALACCLSYAEKQPFKNISLDHFATCMSFNLIRATPSPMDLVRVQLSDQSIVYSFLNVEWAIIADIDLESEKYRFLGGSRFVVGAIKRILNLRVYRGRMSFLPVDDMKDYKPKDSNIQLVRNKNNKEDESDSKFKYLAPINKPVPNDWITFEENFILFLIVNLPLIAPDFLAAPDSKSNDEQMHMIFIKEGITKAQLLQVLASTENGEYLNSPFVEWVKIKAFRLEPVSNHDSAQKEGIIMVDGELVPYGPIQGEILPACANILANYS